MTARQADRETQGSGRMTRGVDREKSEADTLVEGGVKA
jgi:hypothetical protein